MEFGTVVIVVVAVAAVAAAVTYIGVGRLYRRIGRGGLVMDSELLGGAPAPEPGSPAARVEAEAEVRQLVEAASERRKARGEPPLDVEAEVARRLADL